MPRNRYPSLSKAGCAEWRPLVLRILCLLCISTSELVGQTTSGAGELSTAVIARRALPATITLVTFDASGDTLSQGSGFLIRADGIVITNWHVVEGAYGAVAILSDGRTIEGVQYLAADAVADLAVLSLPGTNYPTIAATDTLPEVGSRVVVIGSPLGFSRTVTEGILSATRDLPQVTLVQISAPISHGSSGGPVLNDRGQVFAVTRSMIEEGQAINFSVPISYARRLLAPKTQSKPLAQTAGPAGMAARGQDPSMLRSPSPFLSIYEGTVTNAGYPDWPATLRIGFEGWSPSPHGYLLVGAPLGGSGPVTAGWIGDSVAMMTVSQTGDTILWLAEMRDVQLRGVYRVIGGEWKGQRGKWLVTLLSGDPLPPKGRR